MVRFLRIQPLTGRTTELYKEHRCVHLSSLYSFEDYTLRDIPEERKPELHRGGNLNLARVF